MSENDSSVHEIWARFRHTVIGPLLSAPPPGGALRSAIDELAQREWNHPIKPGERVRFGRSTIERWYYLAKMSANPIEALRRDVREDLGRVRVISDRLEEILRTQYRQFPGWTYQLHHENLLARIERDASLGVAPSYASVRRFMKSRGMRRTKRRGNEKRPGLATARERLDRREVRSFEVEHVGALWHLDFHTSRHVGVLDRQGRWIKPSLLAVLDDHSRLCAHAQFYFEENTEVLVHGFIQALLKRELPRALLTDNGGEMIAAEFVQGLERLSILHETTLPYSPHQNGKQEHFWAVVEQRFLAMLDSIEDLKLDRLNLLLQAWVERDYHRKVHSETGQMPSERFLQGKSVLRPAPSPQVLEEVFRQRITRRVRRSDATLTLEGKRFELPAAYRHYEKVTLLYARWDLSHVHLVDPRTTQPIARLFPLERQRNASGQRRLLEPSFHPATTPVPAGLPPLLERLLEEYQAHGLAPAFLPHHPEVDGDEESER